MYYLSLPSRQKVTNHTPPAIYYFDDINKSREGGKGYTVCKDVKLRNSSASTPVGLKRVTGVSGEELVLENPTDSDFVKVSKWLDRGLLNADRPHAIISKKEVLRMLSH